MIRDMDVEVENFLRSALHYKVEITDRTRLFHDMNVYGDDVEMIMMGLEDRFNVDTAGVKLDSYFYLTEGPDFGKMVNRLLGLETRDPDTKKELTVGDLKLACKLGSLARALN